jgi:glycosyltransferase involved in cell wall biosynthesis
MALARPVVATAVGGVRDLVVDGETGLLVAPDRAGALAAALAQLVGQPARSAEMGRRGRERVGTHFSIDDTARRVQDLYVRLLGRASA